MTALTKNIKQNNEDITEHGSLCSPSLYWFNNGFVTSSIFVVGQFCFWLSLITQISLSLWYTLPKFQVFDLKCSIDPFLFKFESMIWLQFLHYIWCVIKIMRSAFLQKWKQVKLFLVGYRFGALLCLLFLNFYPALLTFRTYYIVMQIIPQSHVVSRLFFCIESSQISCFEP